jgi:hypothetical protein
MSVVFMNKPSELTTSIDEPPLLLGVFTGVLFGSFSGLFYGGLIGLFAGRAGTIAGGATKGGLFGGALGAVVGGLFMTARLWNLVDSPFRVAQGTVPDHPPYWVMGAPWGMLAGLLLGTPLGSIIGGIIRLDGGTLRKVAWGAGTAILSGLLAGWFIQLIWWQRIEPWIRHGWWKY